MGKIKKLNIAIIGLGNIGSYLFNYLKKNKKILSKKNNCVPNVIYISAKNIFNAAKNILFRREKYFVPPKIFYTAAST